MSSWLDLTASDGVVCKCVCTGMCLPVGGGGGGECFLWWCALCVCRDLKQKPIKPVSGKCPWPVSYHVMSTL